jgi:hypothetical protein
LRNICPSRRKSALAKEDVDKHVAALSQRHNALQRMQPHYPQKIGALLESLLGNVNVTLPVAIDRFFAFL